MSDIYGGEGSTELRKIAKAMRLTRDHLKEEGHPVNEHYVVPAPKHPNMMARGALCVGQDEFGVIFNAKMKRVRLNILKAVVFETPDASYSMLAVDDGLLSPEREERLEDRAKERRRFA